MMKNGWLKSISIVVIILLMVIHTLNIKVKTQQGLNYKVQAIEIPLYLKILNFFDRHYNYKWTVERITGNSKLERSRVLKIFEWTYENIKTIPFNYPVIDDHAWHIMIRGYGTNDQSSDVFTTLCNYAGLDAFYEWIYAQDRGSRIPLSFVKVDGRWCVFDPFNGVYFEKLKGGFVVKKMPKENWRIEYIDKQRKIDIDYTVYLRNLPSVENIGLRRSKIQSPLNRLKYEINKLLKLKPSHPIVLKAM